MIGIFCVEDGLNDIESIEMAIASIKYHVAKNILM